MKRLFIAISLIFYINSLWALDVIFYKAIDGDTYYTSIGQIRLIGIDTPESHFNKHIYKQLFIGNEKEILYWGREAKRFVKRILHYGDTIRVEFDKDKKDPAGRYLVYVYLKNNKMINEMLLEEGLAYVYIFLPNDKYKNRFLKAQERAKKLRKGFWNF